MDFVDGGGDARALINSFSGGWTAMIFQLLRNARELWSDLGVNPGNEFERWLKSILDHDNYQDLLANLRRVPGGELILRDNIGRERYRLPADALRIKLGIVAADITTQTKVEFPAMAPLYYENPETVNPAEFVRASMSIPGFFQPHRVDLSWVRGKTEVERQRIRRRWRKKADFTGHLPHEVLFADGGIMSNFPIDLFHGQNEIPNLPTFGVKLGIDRNQAHDINNLQDYAKIMFDGVRNLRDFEFLAG